MCLFLPLPHIDFKTNTGVIKAVVFRDAKELKDDPSIHLAAAAAAAAAAYGRHSVNIDDAQISIYISFYFVYVCFRVRFSFFVHFLLFFPISNFYEAGLSIP